MKRDSNKIRIWRFPLHRNGSLKIIWVCVGVSICCNVLPRRASLAAESSRYIVSLCEIANPLCGGEDFDGIINVARIVEHSVINILLPEMV